MAYGVVRTDSVKATKAGNIKSGRYYVGDTPTAIDNGCIVKLDSLISGERDLWKVVAPGGIAAGNLYIVASPEIIYDESLKSSGALDKFQNAAGANITLIPLEVGDTFSISDDVITEINDDDDIPAVGNYVTPSATGVKWTEIVAGSLNTEVFRGKIIAREIYNGTKYLNVVEMISVR
jgi:hypothetical protein